MFIGEKYPKIPDLRGPVFLAFKQIRLIFMLWMFYGEYYGSPSYQPLACSTCLASAGAKSQKIADLLFSQRSEAELAFLLTYWGPKMNGAAKYFFPELLIYLSKLSNILYLSF